MQAEDAILALARAVRAAESRRINSSHIALEGYDEGLHGRSEVAVAYLKSVKAADDIYEAAIAGALDEYAKALA